MPKSLTQHLEPVKEGRSLDLADLLTESDFTAIVQDAFLAVAPLR